MTYHGPKPFRSSFDSECHDPLRFHEASCKSHTIGCPYEQSSAQLHSSSGAAPATESGPAPSQKGPKHRDPVPDQLTSPRQFGFQFGCLLRFCKQSCETWWTAVHLHLEKSPCTSIKSQSSDLAVSMIIVRNRKITTRCPRSADRYF